MKVLYVIHSHYRDVLKRPLDALVKILSQKGHDPVLAYVQQENAGDFSDAGSLAKTRVFKKKNGFDFSLIKKLTDCIKEERIQLVHTHDLEALPFSVLAAQFSRRPSVHTQHFRVNKSVPNWVFRLNKAVVCSSLDVKDNLCQYHNIPGNKFHVIYNGIDLAHIDKETSLQQRRLVRREFGFQDDTFVIGNVGHCVAEEDQASIIKALKKLISRDLNAQLLIVGDGPMKDDLMKVAREYGVLERLNFLAPNGDATYAFSAMDCLVLSNFQEGRPLTLLEAMAARKPVIATSIGANKEIIEERKNGYLVSCGFPERIHSALMRLKAIESLSAQIGEAGRKTVEERFSLDIMGNQHVRLYQQLV